MSSTTKRKMQPLHVRMDAANFVKLLSADPGRYTITSYQQRTVEGPQSQIAKFCVRRVIKKKQEVMFVECERQTGNVELLLALKEKSQR
jgi:hypothetical protein